MNWRPCYDATRFAFLAPRLQTDVGVNLWLQAGLAVCQLHCHHFHYLLQSWSLLMDQMQNQLQEEKLHFVGFEVHGGDYVECHLLGRGAVWDYYKSTFWRIVLPSSSG
jgi:hypothetical protein